MIFNTSINVFIDVDTNLFLILMLIFTKRKNTKMLEAIYQKILWLKTEISYRLTSKKYEVRFSEEAKKQTDEILADMSEEDKKEFWKFVDELAKNPNIGERLKICSICGIELKTEEEKIKQCKECQKYSF